MCACGTGQGVGDAQGSLLTVLSAKGWNSAGQGHGVNLLTNFLPSPLRFLKGMGRAKERI